MTARSMMRSRLEVGRPLRWAVLAPGGIARDFTRALHVHSRQRVVSVGSRSIDRAALFASEFGIERSYGSYAAAVVDPAVQAVYVAAPNALHKALALLAIEAGKPVLVEKPLATNANDAQAIASASLASGVLAMEAMWTRYLPQSIHIAGMLKSGSLGDIRLATADVGWRAAPDRLESKIFQPELGGGTLLDAGVYAVWFAQFVLGRPTEVRAIGSRTPSGVTEQIAAVLGADSNRHAALTSSLAVTNSGYASVLGTEGSVEFLDHFVFPSRLSVRRGGTVTEWSDDSGLRGREGLVWQASAFADYLDEGRLESPLHSLADSVSLSNTMAEIDAQILRS